MEIADLNRLGERDGREGIGEEAYSPRLERCLRARDLSSRLASILVILGDKMWMDEP